MPIVVQCGACRKQYQVGDQFAGKTVKCPGCQKPLVIPGGQATPQQSGPGNCLADLFDDEMPVHHAAYGQAESRCPNCNVSVKPDAILCIECGYDFRKGRQIIPDTPAERQARYEAREAKMRGEAPGAKKKEE
jgi:DNA-directed RNA polymerase subunit RPC12/RpoP